MKRRSIDFSLCTGVWTFGNPTLSALGLRLIEDCPFRVGAKQITRPFEQRPPGCGVPQPWALGPNPFGVIGASSPNNGSASRTSSVVKEVRSTSSEWPAAKRSFLQIGKALIKVWRARAILTPLNQVGRSGLDGLSLAVGSYYRLRARWKQLLFMGRHFALLLVYGGTLQRSCVAQYGERTRCPSGGTVRVGQLGTSQAASFLRPDDEVLAVNGEQIRRASDIADVFHNIEPDRTYTVLIKRGGIPLEIKLTSQAVPLLSLLVNAAARLVIPNIFLLTGLIVFMLKPYDKQALLLALMFGMFTGALPATDPNYAGESGSVGIMLAVHLARCFVAGVLSSFRFS